MAMAERKGLDGRTSRRSKPSGCECGFSLELCLHDEIQHGNLYPQILIRFVASSRQSSVTSDTRACVLSEQFSKYANIFFLFTACIQQIPGVSPTNKWTTIAPLSVVLFASAFKEVQEDLVRCEIHIFLPFAPDPPYLVRNDTNLTPTSIPVLQKCSDRPVLSTRQDGRISESVMSYGSRTTTLSQQILFFSVQVNQKGFAILKPPILTGAHTIGPISIFVT